MIEIESRFNTCSSSFVKQNISVDLIQAVNELSGGYASDETTCLLTRLGRKLPPVPDPVKLFALNYDVDKCNSDCLLMTEGTYNTAATPQYALASTCIA